MIQTQLTIRTSKRTEYIDITADVKKMVHESGITSGLCTVFIPHTTAGVTINEAADPDVRRDMVTELNKIVPFDDCYHHAEGNSAAHIKTTLTGSSVTVPISNGTLQLGTWQGIYFCEYDGARSRKALCTLISG
jgi:secondary thiamine-phosphate synthase enzyme